jgi:glycosyltransferase involved in cell wall biosynthesis
MSELIITVLITTHNYGRFIEEAIASVLSQDFPLSQVEVLVVDDGSTDDTQERLKEYGSRIRYFYKPNGGQAAALNYGIARASGEIVAFLDADDLFLPGKLKCVVDAFQKNPALGMVYHRLLEWHVQTDERRERTFAAISGDIHKIPDQFISYVSEPASCVSFRRSALKPLLPIPEDIRMLGDCYLVTLIPFLTPILAVPEFLALYRIHGSNNYGADERELPLEVQKRRLHMWGIVTNAMCEWLDKNGVKRQAPERAFLNSWIAYHSRQRFEIEPPGRLKYFRFVVRENYINSRNQTWKFTVFNYIVSPLVLLFGYRKRNLVEEWQGRFIRNLQALLSRFFATREKDKARARKI